MVSRLMNARCYPRLLSLLVTVLLLSAVVPCGAFEAGETRVCTSEAGRPDGSAGTDDERPADVLADCCAGCLTCCVSYTEPAAARSVAPAHAVPSAGISPWQRAPGAPLPIWRPPRG